MSSQHRDEWREYSQPYAVHSRPLPPPSHVVMPPVDSIQHGSYTRSLPLPARWEAQPFALQRSNSATTDDASKPSLPSISNLLVIADRDRPTGHFHAHSRSLSPQQTRHSRQPSQGMKFERSRHAAHSSDSTRYPPVKVTQFARHDSGQEGVPPSPSTISTTSSSRSGPPYFAGSSINNLDAHDQHVAHSHFEKRSPHSPQSETSPYSSSYTGSPHTTSRPAIPGQSYYSPQISAGSNSYHEQRHLPSAFSSSTPLHMQPVSIDVKLPAMNPWEHHHYISPSASAGYPSTQDRYQCMTCKKAFSRPSSLKIHSHSHTGEKPFRCAHSGCNKSFSVRSNMKRHERGCHSGGGSLVASAQHLTVS